MEKIIQVVHEHGLLSQVTISENTFALCEKNPESDISVALMERYEIAVPKAVPKEKVNQLNSGIEKLTGVNVEISHKFGVNEKMANYKNLHKVFSEESAQLAHRPGEVMLVDVWATWCGPCQRPMQHNQEMLEKNAQNWKDKFRVVAVSVDEEKQVIKNKINTKGWTRIQHLTLLGWDNTHPLISDFEVQGIPFVFLVDRNGKINFTGHPSEINLEERINELIAADLEENEATNVEIKEITQEVRNEIKAKQEIKKLFAKQKLEEKFGKVDLFQAIGTIGSTINRGKVGKGTTQFKVSSFEDVPELIKEFRTFFKDVDPKAVKIEENLVKFTNVPSTDNASCVDCQKALAFPFYWCRWDANPNSFRCRECTEKPLTEEGLHYVYNNNSVLLAGPTNRIALKGLGNNIQPAKDDIKTQNRHSFGCNGCGGSPKFNGEARYICLGCRNDPNMRGDYIDMCSKCYRAFFAGDENVKSSLEGDGHKATHPLLRILYNVKGYYDF